MSGIIAQNSGRHTGLVKAASGGVWTLIKTLTASASGTLDFVNGASDVVLDSTFSQYQFQFINIHPATDETFFSFNMSIDGGSNYNVAKQSTFFSAQQGESGTGAELNYEANHDLALGTGFQRLTNATGDDNDNSASGYLNLYAIASTVHIKHFIAVSSNVFKYSEPYAYQNHIAGYGNTSSAVDSISFKMSAGDIDSGTISLFGIS